MVQIGKHGNIINMEENKDYQKIDLLKIQWLDKLREMDRHNQAIQQLQQEVMQLQKQVEEEEAKM